MDIFPYWSNAELIGFHNDDTLKHAAILTNDFGLCIREIVMQDKRLYVPL